MPVDDCDTHIAGNHCPILNLGSNYGGVKIAYDYSAGKWEVSSGSSVGGGLSDRVDASTSFTADTWEHVVVTFEESSGTWAIYVNGALIDENSNASHHMNAGGSDVNVTLIGYQGGNDWWKGGYDEMSIWNRALSSDEVTELYGKKVSDMTDVSELLIYYDFDNLVTDQVDPIIHNDIGTTRTVTVNAQATKVGVELDGTFYPSDVTSNDWVHHVLTKGVAVSTGTIYEDHLDEATTHTSQLDEQAEKYGIKILTGSDLIGKNLTSFSLNIGIANSPTGTVTSSIYRDGSSTPHETSTTTYPIASSGWSSTPVQVDFEYAGTTTLQADDRIVYECDGGTSSCHDGSNQIKFERNNNGFTTYTQIALYYSGVWQGFGGGTTDDALYKVGYCLLYTSPSPRD